MFHTCTKQQVMLQTCGFLISYSLDRTEVVSMNILPSSSLQLLSYVMNVVTCVSSDTKQPS